jgi:hypothetical protein
MKTAIRLIMGLSILATAVGCDNAGDGEEKDGPNAVAGTGTVIPGGGNGTSGSTGTSGGSSGGTGNTDPLPEGVPLTSADGWVDAMSNTLGIQGAMFAYADETSKAGPPAMAEDFVGPNACISGTAAKVDMTSMPCATKMFTPPATDCYGQYWGAAIGLNLNQPIDMTTMMGADPMPFDASAITGFAFEISGAAVPTSLRFKVEDATGEYCTPPAKPVKLGNNTFMFSDLMTQCWKAGGTSAEGAKSAIIKIAWQVVTNDKAAVPFDYCVSNVRALQ